MKFNITLKMTIAKSMLKMSLGVYLLHPVCSLSWIVGVFLDKLGTVH